MHSPPHPQHCNDGPTPYQKVTTNWLAQKVNENVITLLKYFNWFKIVYDYQSMLSILQSNYRKQILGCQKRVDFLYKYSICNVIVTLEALCCKLVSLCSTLL